MMTGGSTSYSKKFDNFLGFNRGDFTISPYYYLEIKNTEQAPDISL